MSDYTVTIADIETYLVNYGDEQVGSYLNTEGCLLYRTLEWKYGYGRVLHVGGTGYTMCNGERYGIPLEVQDYVLGWYEERERRQSHVG